MQEHRRLLQQVRGLQRFLPPEQPPQERHQLNQEPAQRPQEQLKIGREPDNKIHRLRLRLRIQLGIRVRLCLCLRLSVRIRLRHHRFATNEEVKIKQPRGGERGRREAA